MLVDVTPSLEPPPPPPPHPAATAATSTASATPTIHRWLVKPLTSLPLHLRWFDRATRAGVCHNLGPLVTPHAPPFLLPGKQGAHPSPDAVYRPLDAVREEQHRHDQGEAVDRRRQVVLHLARETERLAEVVGPGRQVDQQGRAPDGAAQRAESADHDRRHELQRERDVELRWSGEVRRIDEQGAGQAGAGRADHEGAHLRARDVNPRQRRSDLVVPYRLPETSRTAAPQVGEQDERHYGRREGDPRVPALERHVAEEGRWRRWADREPLLAAEGALVPGGYVRQGERQRQRDAGQVGAAQAGGRDPDD